ncbi:PH domain-containing protein [Candidatus Pacearchaeota archaeon]|nr:PH domain-containing protein [Candidatus Pacearchaeota archaeon]
MLGNRSPNKKKSKEPKKNIMKVRSSRKVYLPVYFMILVLVVALVVVKYNNLSLDKLVLIFAIVFIILGVKFTEVHRLSSSYSLSPSTLTFSAGLVSRRIKNIDFFAISDIDVHQSFWQRMIGFGDVHVSLFADANVIKNINNPVKFANFLEKMIDKKRGEAEQW